MGSALGNPAARATNGSRGFDIRDFGASPGYFNATATRKAIQAAVDSNVLDQGAAHAVYIPSGDWYVDRPVMIDRCIHLIGEPGATLNGVGETTPVVVGIPRAGYYRRTPLAASHLDGVSGIAFKGLYLDPGEHAYIPASPFSNGLPPDINVGTVDAYQITDEVTVEWQQDLGTNPLYAGPLMGMNDGQHACPWVLGFVSYNFNPAFLTITNPGSGYTSAPTVTCVVTGGGSGVQMHATVAGGAVTALVVDNPGVGIQPGATLAIGFSGGGGAGAAATNQATIYGAPTIAGGLQVVAAWANGTKWGSNQRYYFGLPGGLTGKVDFALTISAKQGVIAFWVNGTRQGPLGGSGALPAAGSKLQTNRCVAFQINTEDVGYTGNGPTGQLTGRVAGVTALNRNITGLRYWAGAPYALTGAAGSAQARTDSHALDFGAAGTRYFHQEPGVIAWFPFTDTVADVLAYRQFTVMYGSGTTAAPCVSGLLVSDAIFGYFDWQQGSIRNLSLISPGKYAPGLQVGFVTDYEVRDCTITGGVHALGEITTGANYTFKMTGVNTLKSADISLFLYFSTFEQWGQLTFTNYGRGCIYAAANSTTRFAYVYVVYPQLPALWLFRVNNTIQIDRLGVDFEGPAPLMITGIWMEAVDTGSSPNGQICLIGNVGMGEWPPQASFILIDESDNSGARGEVELRSFSCYSTSFRAVVELTGPGACGEIRETQDIVAPWILNSTPNGQSNLRCTRRADGLPRRSSFATLSSILKPAHPLDGQFTEFRCTAGGTYQAAAPATPPRWTGIAPLDDSGAALATYIQANPAWGSGSSSARLGPVGEVAASRFLNGYLGIGSLNAGSYFVAGATPAPSASVVACLIVDPMGVAIEQVAEAFGGGYARQAITFGASASGVAANTSALTFPTFTAAIGTVTGICFRDPAQNLIIGQVAIDPVVTAPGTVITFPAGSLAIRPMPVPAGGTLGPQLGYVGTQVYDAFNNFYLTAAALPAPAGLRFALSTAPASRSAPTEPVGNGYARVAAGAFAKALGMSSSLILIAGVTSNASAVTFPAPTGSWGTIKSVYLLDGSGNVIFSGNVTIPRAVASGSPAPTIPAGAFWISW